MLAVTCLFSGAWSVLTGVVYPGLNLTIAQILMGTALIIFGLNLIQKHKGGE